MQKARRHPNIQQAEYQDSDWLWANGFRYYFTPLMGYFSPFPHGTSSLSVTESYLAFPGGPGRFPQGSTCPVVLGSSNQRDLSISLYGTITLCGLPFQDNLVINRFSDSPNAPQRIPLESHYTCCTTVAALYMQTGLGCSPFARRY
jgi:hypothetical protein